MSAQPRHALVGLGSNTDGLRELARARGALASVLEVSRVTRPRSSPPEGGGTGQYWNQIVEVQERADLRQICKRIETELGRNRDDPTRVTIDIDLLRTADFEADELTARDYWRPHLDELAL